MTWGNFKDLVKSKVVFDGASYIDIDTLTDGSPSSDEIWRLLGLYCVAAREFWIPSIALTPDAGAQEIDLMDGANCDREMFLVGTVWRDSLRVQAYDFDALQATFPQDDPEEGSPRGWAMSDDFKLYFDCPLDSDAAASTWKINGFATHAAISDGDDSPLALGYFSYDPAAEFVAAALARPVASMPEAVGRLQSYSQSAAEYIAKRRAKGIVGARIDRRIGV